ncbi:uncharacterized protein N7484_004599 [Penicillium longicatenatum]|uniref:uncharacterized protein n=1 Tax=Penicillium longicatenatum TaxID=1561947 RepID=UPI002549252D|nr:uncharacterized protein N7484_004599 [Penicillium longicatenatum]KAJ5650876.1 hypothetical protein N7484_004599 [Penicillium longicatenatum]
MVHQQSNANAGGSLTDMAPTGTSIPQNAGKQNTIPSIPRPDQRTEPSYFNHDARARPTTAMDVDNAVDIPRSTHDRGQTAEVITGTGDLLPTTVESKRVHMNVPGRSDGRDTKHQGFNRNENDKLAGQSKLEEGADEKIGVHQFFGVEATY